MSQKRQNRGPNGLLRLLNVIFCRVWHRLPGQKFELPDGPVILVGNHLCGLDPLLIQASVNRPICFLMARQYYQSMSYARPFLDTVGVIAVNPGGANHNALREASKVVREGNVICLFPEGAANPPIPLHRMLPGALIISRDTGAPIIPFRISGVWPFDHIHLWRPFIRRSRARVAVGQPLELPQFPHGKSGLSQGCEFICKAIRNLPRNGRMP